MIASGNGAKNPMPGMSRHAPVYVILIFFYEEREKVLFCCHVGRFSTAQFSIWFTNNIQGTVEESTDVVTIVASFFFIIQPLNRIWMSHSIPSIDV